jgi:hypothetical protein
MNECMNECETLLFSCTHLWAPPLDGHICISHSRTRMNECGTLLFSCTSWGSLILKYQSTLAARSGARNIIICRNAKKIQFSLFFREHFFVRKLMIFFNILIFEMKSSNLFH